MFDNIAKDDIIIAFYPCTMFQENNALWFRGKAYQCQNYSLSQKMQVNIERHSKLHLFYTRLCELVKVCVDRGLRLIIENPQTAPHYLTSYWIEPTMIDFDRRERGDYYEKPTQYWFINCEPKNNFIFEPLEWVERKTVNHVTKAKSGMHRTVERSMIHPQYANRFIREFIL